ncbi:MAG: M20/M25/M40 family metallo-hydrolase, partial [Lachnospiraceae bacterium]|nr:M20/M25/M40 family metallo-hydrolase [Lachnospiraceae bacterium]
MSKVVESAKAMMPELIAIRRHFHMYPENSRCEKETSAKVIELLKEMGVDEIIENVNGYGVIGVIKGANEGGVVGIRADMDALQVQEMNDVEFKSRNEGCMHACGHDAHTAGLIGAGKILCQNRDM